MKTKVSLKEIFDILYEVIPNELEDYFNISYSEKVKNFIEDICIDIKDNIK